jgi:ribonuclease HI
MPVAFLDCAPHQIDRAAVAAQLRFRRFTETSSTKLELQTVLWALNEYLATGNGADSSLTVLTDSQCVVGLPERRVKLEANGFIARRSGLPLRNADLYRQFYAAHDVIGFTLAKVAGHARAGSHDTVQRIFSVVDQDVRRAMSKWLAKADSK